MKISLIVILLLALGFGLKAQKVNDSTTPLHLMKPDYDTPYGKPELKSIVRYNFMTTNPVQPGSLIIMLLVRKLTTNSYEEL